MKRLYMTVYRYREGLDEHERQVLVKKFLEIGTAPGAVAHYERLDGQGGFVVHETPDDMEKNYENTLRYLPWLEFEDSPSPRWRTHSRLSSVFMADIRNRRPILRVPIGERRRKPGLSWAHRRYPAIRAVSLRGSGVCPNKRMNKLRGEFGIVRSHLR